MSLYFRTLQLLPKNALSRLMGYVTSLRLPKWFVQKEIHYFSSHFGVNLSEIKEPLTHFKSLQEFFTRELKPGARTVDADEQSLISPCDGSLGQSGQVESGTLLQIKGRPYQLSDLLGDDDLAKRLEGGDYATFYLSPKDYHRFHMPFSAHVQEALYWPGQLWPVNPWAVENCHELFCVNERIVMVLKSSADPNEVAVLVAVGATMVGKIRVHFDTTLTSNLSFRKPERRRYSSFFAKGDELGYFEFGSTLVLVTSPRLAKINSLSFQHPLKMGERVGTILCCSKNHSNSPMPSHLVS